MIVMMFFNVKIELTSFIAKIHQDFSDNLIKEEKSYNYNYIT